MKARMGSIGARLRVIGVGWSVVPCLFADDSVTCRECKGTSESSGLIL